MSTSDLTHIRRQLADRYALERELGRGGMGAVYLARDLQLDRPVALKVLPVEFAADPALHERFLREMRTTASFSHPNIVPVHSVEERDGLVAYAMGYVEGESLAQRVQRSGPLSVRELVRLLQDVGYALAYAHGRGVAHRDIKPDNIMLERATGRALLMDFGIARAITEPTAGGGLTRVGEVVGTPEYMSPEQASGDVVDGRSDLYSLGLVAWYAAVGRTAVTGDSTQKIIVKQLTEQVPPIDSVRPELPDLLSAAIDRCVAKLPEERFASAEALVEAVDNSQLAGPDIPLPVRSFVAELEVLSTVFLLLTVVTWTVSRAMARLGSSFDAIIPMVLLVGIGLARFLQVLSEARHLAVMGYSIDEIFKGMHGVYDERESVREARRADPDTQRRRRFTVRMALLMLVVAAGLIGIELATRTRVAPNRYAIPPWALAPLFTGLTLAGAAFALLARTPFRAPPQERILRRVWMGPVGRALLGVASRGVTRSAGSVLTPLAALSRSTPVAAPVSLISTARVVPTPSGNSGASAAMAAPHAETNGAAPHDAALARLEDRVARLEEWRHRAEG
ncbi:MAG: serine/threonine protein kinase [Gemmatimonadaceae bacterium]|nr:serine/threonine protein kinase [Gemmatimonadota bacterium]MCC7324120.1 serine/threonine protein kinase [Gemmatimonadaceae bacterium]